MATEGYNRFAEQAKGMRDELVAAATAEADRWLNETLAMLERLHGSTPRERTRPTLAREARPMQDGNGREGISLTEIVREAITAIPTDRFNSVDIRRAIEPHREGASTATQRANLANLLRRMVERGELELMEQGKGSRPSVYRKTTQQDKEVNSMGGEAATTE